MKGQISSIDALIAILLFTGIYAFLTSAYQGIDLERDEFESLSLKTSVVSSNLLSSQGEPFNWTQADVSQFGLVVNRGVIERNKLAAFLNLSQNNLSRTSELLGVSGYGFYFNVSYLNGSIVSIAAPSFNGQAVIGSDFNSTTAASVRSLAVYDNLPVFVIIKIGVIS
ncbi:MAG: hypothetical protein Q8R15_01080 [Candidatus Micrarchaeota archaeon]|nr:hypothetical protein [Candidatus Micrarchaeota archaeon]